MYENLGVQMSIKTFCSSYCKFHDNVFVQAGNMKLLQPFDGHLEVRDNHFVTDLSPGSGSQVLPGRAFGVTEQFPAWLKDRPGEDYWFRGRAVDGALARSKSPPP